MPQGIIGAGGKTTLLYQLAHELASLGSPVLATTTTRILYPDSEEVVVAGDLGTASDLLARGGKRNTPLVLGRAVKDKKLLGVPAIWVEELASKFAYVLVEADGSAQRPLKGYAAYEPVLPPNCTLVVAVAGLSVLGKPLNEAWVHRPGEVERATSSPQDEMVAPWVVVRQVEEMLRLGRLQSPGARQVVVLNQADATAGQDQGRLMGKALPLGTEVLLGSLLPEPSLEKITGAGGKVAAVVLAAGLSNRMGGSNKLLLPLENKTVIEHTVDNLVAAGPRQVVVVLGHAAAEVRSALASRPVTFVNNERYFEGQATSIRAGLQALEPVAPGTMFVLGDLPLVPPEAYRLLATAFMVSAPDACYPSYRGRRGNPVIFHRRLFPQLQALSGDTGGRRLLATAANVIKVPVATPWVCQDLDTPDDWMLLSKARS